MRKMKKMKKMQQEAEMLLQVEANRKEGAVKLAEVVMQGEAVMQVEDVDYKYSKYVTNKVIKTILVRMSSNLYQSMSTIRLQI